MKNILVPVDGSECSTLAIEKAKEFAKLTNSKIILLNVYDIQTATSFFYESGMTMDLQEDLLKRSTEILAKAKALCADMGDMVETLALEGYPAAKIIDYVEKNDIDLVVMGSHGMSGFKRLFLGSVTHKVAVSINKPILII